VDGQNVVVAVRGMVLDLGEGLKKVLALAAHLALPYR